MSELTIEEKKAKVKDLRPIDDVFFEVLARNPGVMEEILCTILEDDKLIVKDVIVQSDERNLYGRSVRLDALCLLGNGISCNVEVQRSDNDDHFRRVRFNESSITVRDSQSGTDFKEIPDVHVVYISEFDIIGAGHTIYHVNKVIAETGQIVDDGTGYVYVNTAIDDGTDISSLMSCFTKKDFNNPKFPKLSKEVSYLKTTEGGLNSMCTVMKYYEDIAEQKGRSEGRSEGLAEGKRLSYFEMVQDGDLNVKKAAQKTNLTEEEFLKEMELAGFKLPKEQTV
ncbi:PD-(D/E)XK nuclease family transposase [Oribacterium sp. P6A1]|uniref:PD-(D/E)XK nuclease family transposase n=1 Tax=Oribacterium sp. P6A1 TaxID=1410612 RepID=UPI00069259A5|nr:PD-(D/E)XK nuclease family transposase [Oribacterium sp. P6A1]